MKAVTPRRLRQLHRLCDKEMEKVLATRLHQAAVLLELRHDGLAAYWPDVSLLGPTLRELQADVNQLADNRIDLRLFTPIELCGISSDFGNDSPLLDLTIAACYTRAGQMNRGRDGYVRSLMQATSRSLRARCLSSIAAIHCIQGDYVAAESFSTAAMRENPGMKLVQSNDREIREFTQKTGF